MSSVVEAAKAEAAVSNVVEGAQAQVMEAVSMESLMILRAVHVWQG